MQKVPPDTRSRRSAFASKLSRTQADEVRRRHLAGVTLTRLAAEFDVTVGALSRVVNNHTYRDAAARIALKLSAAVAGVKGASDEPETSRHQCSEASRGENAFVRKHEPNATRPGTPGAAHGDVYLAAVRHVDDHRPNAQHRGLVGETW